MTVRELIAKLRAYDVDRDVIVSAPVYQLIDDARGFHEVDSVEEREGFVIIHAYEPARNVATDEV